MSQFDRGFAGLPYDQQPRTPGTGPVETVDAVELIPQQPQRQDGTDDQVRDIVRAANRLGCYDAADWIRKAWSDPRG